jgi:hypothetical protein
MQRLTGGELSRLVSSAGFGIVLSGVGDSADLHEDLRTAPGQRGSGLALDLGFGPEPVLNLVACHPPPLFIELLSAPADRPFYLLRRKAGMAAWRSCISGRHGRYLLLANAFALPEQYRRPGTHGCELTHRNSLTYNLSAFSPEKSVISRIFLLSPAVYS